jgi:chromatin remodeling complex protein RSC6
MSLETVQPTSEFELQFDTIQQSFTKLKTAITDIQCQLRALEKTAKKENKETKKKEPKMRQPKITGFDIQEKIKPELAAFMKLPIDSTSTRNAVTTYITEYIRQQKLQDMTERKRINLNDDLAGLFKLSENPHLTYFNLHKHISSLFIRD